VVFDLLAPADALIVAGYFAAVVFIGVYHGRRGTGGTDFINGSRRMPWGAVLGSIVATEVSAATFLATPGVGYGEDMSFLQFGVGSFLARIFIAFVFVGAFYAADSLTIYAFLAKRFGERTRFAATACFIATRLLASAVRLMIAATGLELILGIPFGACLAVFTAVAILYTGSGGIRGIIWTDVLQAAVFILSGLVLVAYVGGTIGWGELWATGSAHGRFEIFRFLPDASGPGAAAWLNDPKLFYVAVLFGFVSTTAAFGTDQDMTQRMLTCRDARSARRSVILSGFIAIPVAALFLLVGVALFAFYQLSPDPQLPLAVGGEDVAADKVFPWFIRTQLPDGLRGLLLVGVLAAAMSSLDSTMGALSSSALVDLYRPLLRSGTEEGGGLLLSRLFVVAFGIALALVAWALRNAEGFLWLTFKIGSITYGSLLGVFLLGILTRRGSDRLNAAAMASGILLCASLLALMENGRLALGWTWLIVIGTAWTFGVGFLGRAERSPKAT
jgi:SSS family transporter